MLRILKPAFVCCVFAALLTGGQERSISLHGIEYTGFAVASGKLFLWGHDAWQVDLKSGARQKIAIGEFEEGGCILDGGVVLNSVAPRELIWVRLSDHKRFRIDTSVDTRDAIAADLMGHHGVLLIHKRQQVRFYDFPSPMRDNWTESELYSIYTPSTEGGLLVADIDGDGLPDLLCGNYWMKSPTSFELPWREFAIDLWSEQEGSAMLRLAHTRVDGHPVRIAGQRDLRPARASWFEPPTQPDEFLKQIWQPHSLGEFQGVSGLLLVKDTLLLAERDAPGRLMIFRRSGAGFQAGREVRRGAGIRGIVLLPQGGVLLLERSQGVFLTASEFN